MNKNQLQWARKPCIKYKSHIVEMAGKEQPLANKKFIHVFVYKSGDTLFVSKKEHNSGSIGYISGYV